MLTCIVAPANPAISLSQNLHIPVACFSLVNTYYVTKTLTTYICLHKKTFIALATTWTIYARDITCLLRVTFDSVLFISLFEMPF